MVLLFLIIFCLVSYMVIKFLIRTYNILFHSGLDYMSESNFNNLKCKINKYEEGYVILFNYFGTWLKYKKNEWRMGHEYDDRTSNIIYYKSEKEAFDGIQQLKKEIIENIQENEGHLFNKNYNKISKTINPNKIDLDD